MTATGNEPAGQAPTTPGAGWHRAGGADLTKPRRMRRRGGGGWGSGNREAAMVPEAEFTGRPKLARNAEYAAGVGALASVVLLIDDLGRPERFLHMLRVFKPTSPLSVGSCILSPFSALASAAAGVRLLELKPVLALGAKVLPVLPSLAGAFPVLRKASAVGAAAFGGPMATYTAVLIANTAVPSWHAPHDELPFVFAGSAMAAGGGITMALTPVDEAGPSRKAALTGVAVELAAMHRVENGHGIVSEPYHEGKAGALLRAAKAATLSGAGSPRCWTGRGRGRWPAGCCWRRVRC